MCCVLCTELRTRDKIGNRGLVGDIDINEANYVHIQIGANTQKERIRASES